MARQVDKRKTRKALRRLKRVTEQAAAGDAVGLNDWEKDFVAGVSLRLETYGSAFRDPAKGALEEALSQRQTQVVRALGRKGRAKAKPASPADAPASPADPSRGKGLKRKSPLRSRLKGKAPKPPSRGRDINEDMPAVAPALRIIRGGRKG